MDSKDPRKINPSGHENHGVHVCHKCGWPFPNRRPSAKHRRAHKRICGTIEGYKLIDSEENPHITVSDGEHPSVDDHKTPSPKIVKRSNNEGGVGERCNRSEDDMFPDAVTDFSDAGPSSVAEELLGDAGESVSNVRKIIENDPVTTQSIKDGTITEIIQPPNKSTDSSQMQNTEAPESMSNPLGTAPLPQDHMPSSTISSMANSILDSGTEESVVVLSDKNGLACDLFPTKPITATDSPQENKKTNAGEDVTECCASSIGMESDTQKNEANNLEENLLDNAVSPSENTRETSEAGSRLEEMNGNTSDPIAYETVLSNKEKIDGLGPKLPPSDLAPEDKSVLRVETFVDTTQVQVDKKDARDLISELGAPADTKSRASAYMGSQFSTSNDWKYDSTSSEPINYGRSQSQRVSYRSDTTNDFSTMCGATNQDGSSCRRQPAEGGKRCWQHKGMRGDGSFSSFDTGSSPVYRNAIYNDYSTTCGATNQDGSSCRRQPAEGGKRCWQHKGMWGNSSFSSFDTGSSPVYRNAIYNDYSTTCGATNQDGSSCRRQPAEGGKRCWQHKGMWGNSSFSSFDTGSSLGYRNTIYSDFSSTCGAPTRNGYPCSRRTVGGRRCWQH